MPALAVAEELRAEGAEVSFIGGQRAEAELVPAAGFALETIAVQGLSRSNPPEALRALALAAAALPRARSLLQRLAPGAVMGAGGYVAGPVGLSALSLRIPLVLTEADSHLGMTNRALAPFARRVCLAFALPGRQPPRYLVTGRPTAAAVQDRRAARGRLGIAPEETCVLVFGGSLGARSINLAAIEAFAAPPSNGAGRIGRRGHEALAARPSAGAPLRVLHVCGRRDHAELAARALPGGYDLREYLDLAAFHEALAAADLAIARAGGSVFELAAHGLPAILVPYPHAAADHQSANARWMSAAGAAVVIPDAQLSAERLREEVAELLADRPRLAARAGASLALARPDAAREVARELLAAAAARA